LINHNNNILKWNGIRIVGHLVKVDKEDKIDKLLGTFYDLLNCGKLITAGNTIAALADIVLAKPQYTEKITEELLKVENYDYDTIECRNIVIGHVINALNLYFCQISDIYIIIPFLYRQTNNSRNATSKKAQKFLKKINAKFNMKNK